jgi:phosphatidylinositol alpha 1,6-mannosyltransferase
VTQSSIRVAFFPDVYCEIDGVAKTSREFAAYAEQRGLPFLLVHAGPRNEAVQSGSVTRVQLKRSPVRFPVDRAHEFDCLFMRHYGKIERMLKEFGPSVIQITGPSDVGVLGTVLAHKMQIPLAATWQTNLHEFAARRISHATRFLPRKAAARVAGTVERWSYYGLTQYYRIPRFHFSPNRDVCAALEKATQRPCHLMAHAVDTAAFSPEFRDRADAAFHLGFVGRLTPEKNVRALARLEKDLIARGHKDFSIVFIGDGAEKAWLQANMRHAEFTGVLTGRVLSRAFANLDLLVFPSETDTFGLAVLEALSSGVPAVVTAKGGPKYTVQDGKTGFVAGTSDEFAKCTAALMEQPELLRSMRGAARQYAISSSWDKVFEGMYSAYEQHLSSPELLGERVLDVATT